MIITAVMIMSTRAGNHCSRQRDACPLRCPCSTRTAHTPSSRNPVRCPALGQPRGLGRRLCGPGLRRQGDLSTGIAAAAGYLGYDKPDSFRRARSRHPIPGETRTEDGRPAWPPATLRTWHEQRKVAGSHTTGREPD